MKVDFYIDYSEDLRYVLSRLTRLDPAGLENRIKDKGLPVEMVRGVLDASSEKEKTAILDQFMKEYYKENLENFEKVKNEYQEIWQKNSETFFQIASKLMGSRKWNHDEYFFLIGSFYSRAQWGKGNKLAVYWKREPSRFWFLNGYELILSHVFEIFDQLFEKRPVSEWHVWALSESIAYLLVYQEEQIKGVLWPNVSEPTKFSYPQLMKHINFLGVLRKRESNFDVFIKQSIDYFKNFSQEELTSPTSCYLEECFLKMLS